MLYVHDRLAVHDRRVLWTAGAILLLTLPLALLRTDLDMSFRPLFAHEPDTEAATAEFETRFGQSSGSQVAIMVQRDRVLDGRFLTSISDLTEQLRAQPNVVEVLSPARLPHGIWTGDGAHGALTTSPDVLRAPEAAEAAARGIRVADLPVVADSGRTILLLARLDIPLDELQQRRGAIRAIRAAADAWRPPDVRISYTGVSVVEAAYADAIPAGMALSLVLTTAAVVVLLFGVFGNAPAAVIALSGVAVAIPLTIAGLALGGWPLTMLSSMAPTVILIVGVADAIHMLRRWRREAQVAREGAVRRMMAALALPCALTTLTTAVGFLALVTARIDAIRQFGITAAAGVVIVFAANMVLVPALLRSMRVPIIRAAPPQRSLMLVGLRRPRATLAAATLFGMAAIAGVPRIVVDQRFNEELPPAHPATTAQALIEREFGGFLGPDIEITRADGRSILDPDALARIAALQAHVTAMPGVDDVSSVLDLLPRGTAGSAARRGIEGLREDPLMQFAVRELVHSSERVALRVRTGDLGTRAALALAADIEDRARQTLGTSFQARVVGQWWLAQLGTASLLRDMLVSFATSLLLVLPILALALRSRHMLLIALPANLLPMLAALAFMGWTGTTLRVGTALVLAIALAIAVDDTIHLLARTHEERLRGLGARRAMRAALLECAPALTATTVVLLAGFGSMLASQIAAIRDMGIVAAVALGTALAADLLIVPALYRLCPPSDRVRTRHAAHTSFAGSSSDTSSGRLVVDTAHVSAAHQSEAWE